MTKIKTRKNLPGRERSHLENSSKEQVLVRPLNSSRDLKKWAKAPLCKRASLYPDKDHRSCMGMDRLDPQANLVGNKLLRKQGYNLKANLKERQKKINLKVHRSLGFSSRV